METRALNVLPLLLHGADAVAWDSWTLAPTLVGGAVLVAGLYAWAVQTGGRPVPWPRVAAFCSGWLVMFLALASPLDAAAERLLSMHMLQHVALTTIGPPLVLLGLPRGVARRALSASVVSEVGRVLTHPLLAGGLFMANMWLWHVPPMYEAALRVLTVHVLMHVAFMATGLLFWWPVVSPLPELRRLGVGGRLLYLFATGFPMGILALLLISATSVIYDSYALQPRLWGISALTDQQLAGLIMGGLGEAAAFIAFSILFWRFLGAAEEELTDAGAIGVTAGKRP